MSLEKEEGHESPIAHDAAKDDIKKTPEYKKVYHIRHRLQRLVYNKKEVGYGGGGDGEAARIDSDLGRNPT